MERAKDKVYEKLKQEKLKDYILIYKKSDLKRRQELKKEIYSLNLKTCQKDNLWLMVVRQSKN